MTRYRRAARAMLAVTAGTLLTGITVNTAFADPELDPADVPVSTVDADRSGSITIHKFEEPDTATGLPNDGSEVAADELDGLVPMAGVEFTVQLVPGIDLATNEGWQAASVLTVADAVEAVAQSDVSVTVTTDADGIAIADGLPVGLYLVTEVNTPAGVKAVAPFLVSVPLTDPASQTEWLYDIHVYPKNVVTTATKSVADADARVVGDIVTWTITADIPNGGRTDAYRVVDILDEALEYDSAVVELSNGAAMTAGVDYNIIFDADTNTVMVDFTSAGLDLLAANDLEQVVVTIQTVVVQSGTISNQAQVFSNQESIDSKTPASTPKVETRFGNVTLEKVGQRNEPLAGAEFQVYLSLEDALAGANPISIDGVSTWTSGAGGLVTISGLRYSNYIDGATMTEKDYQHYYLVEVKAPEGHELLAEPVEFDVLSDDQVIDLTIVNPDSNAGFELPLTGAAGTYVILTIGALLLIGGALLALQSRRKKAVS